MFCVGALTFEDVPFSLIYSQTRMYDVALNLRESINYLLPNYPFYNCPVDIFDHTMYMTVHCTA